MIDTVIRERLAQRLNALANSSDAYGKEQLVRAIASWLDVPDGLGTLEQWLGDVLRDHDKRQFTRTEWKQP
jgi:hypothetical protein